MKIELLSIKIGNWTRIIGVPAAFLGLMLTFFQIITTLQQIKSTQKIEQLKSIDVSMKMIECFVNTRIKAMEDLDMLKRDTSLTPEKLFTKYGSGERIYLSPEFKSIREFRGYLDQLAVYVKMEIISFDIIFELVTFPDLFWQESIEYRNIIAENYWGEKKPLTDFDTYIEELYNKYKKARKRL